VTDTERAEPEGGGRLKQDNDKPGNVLLCLKCQQELDGMVSPGTRALYMMIEGFFDFFWYLFSRHGRAFRRFVYLCIAIYFAYRLLRHHWSGISGAWTRRTSSPRAWLGDHPWLAAGLLGMAVLLIVYRLWRRRQIKLGIKSPPWLLITFVALMAFGVSAAGGLLLYNFAPDQGAKFDAVKTALTMFAGAAGVGALVLSLRTHFTGETDRLNTQFDAAAQKLTDESPIVQSAGLVALQRLARRHAAYRVATQEILLAYSQLGKEDSEPSQGSGSEKVVAHRLDQASRIWDEFA
jgi:hypothetical protein